MLMTCELCLWVEGAASGWILAAECMPACTGSLDVGELQGPCSERKGFRVGLRRQARARRRTVREQDKRQQLRLAGSCAVTEASMRALR